MNFIKGDIIVRADRNGKETTWVSERILISICDGLTEDYLRKKCRYLYLKTVPVNRREQSIMPDTENYWRFANMNGWYYDIDRVPDTAPANYRSKLGAKTDLVALYEASLKAQKVSDLAKEVNKAKESGWLEFLSDYSGYSADHAKKLAMAAAILHNAVEYMQTQGMDTRRNGFFIDLGELVKDVPYLPANMRRLKDKVVRVLAGETVTEVITLPRTGNSNACKWDDPQVISWITVMRSSGVNYSNAHIARKMLQICAMNDKTPPSKTWTEHYLSRPDVKQMTFSRYGAGGRKAMAYKGYVPMDGAVFSGDCWMMDATRVNFIEFTHNGKDWQHLMVCMVYDVHSGAILARTYGTAENRWMYNQCLAKAATQAEYLPYEVVTDRFPGHNTPEWDATKTKLLRAGVKVHESHIMTGKARLERAIDTVQMIAMQESDKYYGQGIQSRRDYAHRSEESLKAMRKRARAEGWNMDRAIEESEKAFNLYNETIVSSYSRAKKSIDLSPLQMHKESEKPHTVKAEWFELLHFFGLSKRIKVGRQGMIITEIMSVKYTYVIDPKHYDTVKKHDQVTMYYDLEDLNTVHLYTVSDDPGNERYICDAMEQKAVRWTGPETDVKEMGKARKRIADWTAKQDEEMAGHIANTGWSELELIGTGSSKNDKEQAETAAMIYRSKQRPVVVVNNDESEDDVQIDVRALY